MSKKVLKDRELLGIFPEGDTESDELRKPKAGVVYLSASHMVPIVPLGVYGLKKSLWYYLFRGVRPRTIIKIGKPFGPYSISKDKAERESELLENEKSPPHRRLSASKPPPRVDLLWGAKSSASNCYLPRNKREKKNGPKGQLRPFTPDRDFGLWLPPR